MGQQSNYVIERWPQLAELRKQVAIELIRAYGSHAVDNPTMVVQALCEITDAITAQPSTDTSK